MDVIAVSPLAVGGYAWRPAHSAGHAFVVIAKATFVIEPGQMRLAEVQDGLNTRDNHWNDDLRCSVYAPSDMAPYKEGADVTLVGDAFSPSRRGSRSLVVRMKVGNIDKRVAVFCERWLDDDKRICKGAAFRRMALRYERAGSGLDHENPVGITPGIGRDNPLPNLQYMDRSTRRETACFGPIAQSWRLDAPPEDWREQPLPVDLDAAAWCDAPADQRLEEIAVDERIELTHLHPHLPRLATQLPGLQPRAFVERPESVRPVLLTADSLWIDMTRGVCTVTWRGSFEIAEPGEAGRVLVALEEMNQPLTWSEVIALDDSPTDRGAVASGNHSAAVSGIVIRDEESHDAISEKPAARQQAPTLDLAVGADYVDFVDRVEDDAEAEHTMSMQAHASQPALPFVAPAAPQPVVCASKTRVGPWPTTAMAAFNKLRAEEVTTPDKTGPSPTLVSADSSPWIGSLTGVRHRLAPPPSPRDPGSVAPPPLMLVPQDSPHNTRPHNTQDAIADHKRALDRQTHRVELIGSARVDNGDVERIQRHWPDHAVGSGGDEAERDLREAFGAVEPLSPEQTRRQLVKVMTNAGASTPGHVKRALRDAIDDEGVFDAPLCLVHGTLRFTFDELETLKATVACVAPYALGGNERLAHAVLDARGLLESRELQGCPEVAAELTEAIDDAHRSDDAIDSDKIATRIERILLDKRAYQTRTLLGTRWVRALLASDGAPHACYIHESLAKAAPLFARFTARVIAELHPRQDQREQSAVALRTIAFGRIINHEEAS